METSLNQLSELLLINSSHTEGKALKAKVTKLKEQKELGNLAFKNNKYLKAYQIYKEAIKIDPSNDKILSILHHNLSVTNFKLDDFKQASIDATSALKYNPNYIKPLIIRAKCLHKLGRSEECMQDCELVLKVQENDDLKHILKEEFMKGGSVRAKLLFTKSRFNDCIIVCTKILGYYEIDEIRELLDNAKQNFISENMKKAQKRYKMESYEECVRLCDTILIQFVELEEAIILKNTAITQIKIVSLLNEANSNIKYYFEKQMYKECMSEYGLILSSIEDHEFDNNEIGTEISDIIETIRNHIEEVFLKAKQCFESKTFDKCVEHCNSILNIQESSEVRNLADEATFEGTIYKKLTNVKKLYDSNSFKRCINESKKLLKCITKFDEIKKIISNCEIALDEENQNKKMINDIMSEALQNYKKTYYSDCIKDCEKALKYKKVKKAETLMEKAKQKIRNENENYLKISIIRAKLMYDKVELNECIEKCLAILEKKNLLEIKKLLQKSKDELEDAKLENCFDILKIDCNASQTIIKSAYRRLSKKYHPDKNMKISISKERQKYYQNMQSKLNHAYNILKQ